MTFLLENVNAYCILPGKTEARRPSGRRRQSRKESSEIDLKALEREVMESIHLCLNKGQCRAFEKVMIRRTFEKVMISRTFEKVMTNSWIP